MRIKCICCESLYREFCVEAAHSKHIVDLVFLNFGLHNTPEKLRCAIQEEIDTADNSDYDAVVLGYGLCSRGTADVYARSKPVVIIRAHDCITILLGSRQKYSREFSEHPGTYYYSSGWIERKEGESEQGNLNDVWESHYEEKLKEYIEKYGEDNAEYLLEQEKLWLSNYTRAAFIDSGLGDVLSYRKFVEKIVEERNWEYAEMESDLGLIRDLLSGNWKANPDLLLVPPGKKILESFDADIVRISD